LQKIGVDIEIVRAGKYKSTVEPLVTNTMSPEARQMFGKLEEEQRYQWRLAVGQGRDKTSAQLQAWQKQALFTAQDARAQGLIDQVAYFHESKAALLATTKGTWLDFSEYGGLEDAAPLFGDSQDARTGIAYLEAVGEVRMGQGRRGQEEAAGGLPDRHDHLAIARTV
jgi:protease-4